MRASAVKTAIVDSIEAITVDSNVGGEAFNYVDLAGRDPGAISERAFEAELVGVTPSILITETAQIVSFAVTVYYASYEAVEDRIADDAERIIKALTRLHDQNGDIFRAAFDEMSVAPSGFMEGMLEASLPIAVTYRRTGV